MRRGSQFLIIIKSKTEQKKYFLEIIILYLIRDMVLNFG